MKNYKITRPDDAIGLDEWNRIIESFDCLQAMPDRIMINPFTKEKMVASGEGRAYYLENGNLVGAIIFEDGELHASKVPPVVCEIISKRLEAGYYEFEDDRS